MSLFMVFMALRGNTIASFALTDYNRKTDVATSWVLLIFVDFFVVTKFFVKDGC